MEEFEMKEYDGDKVNEYLDAMWQRRETRRKFAEYMKNYEIKDGKRMKMDVSKLDALMFERFMINDKLIKVIALEGDFLKKIDFSGISFDDVLWSANNINSQDFPEFNDLVDVKRLLKEGCYEEVDQAELWYDIFLAYFNCQGVTPVQYRYPLDEKPIDLSGINTDIDFRKGYGWGFIGEYNFSNIEGKLGIPYDAQFYRCNFENMDLEGVNVKYSTEEDDDDLFEASNDVCLYFKDCNLKNTGATIELFVGKDGDIDKTSEQFNEDIKTGKFDGCYFEGELIRHFGNDNDNTKKI